MDSLFFHPRVVHLPIALGVLMPLVTAGLLVAWWRTWLPARGWIVAVALQAILVASGVVSINSGERQEERVERIVPKRFLHEHEEAAEAFVWAAGGVLAVMVIAGALSKRRAGLPLALVATVGTFVVLPLGVHAGRTGGGLVYEHGAAGAYTTAPR
jgi:hypothetical protein